MNDFAKRLRELREQKGLTQTELADIVGVTWSAISKYERGVVDNLPYAQDQTDCGINPAAQKPGRSIHGRGIPQGI